MTERARKISVVINTYNAEKHLEKVIKSVQSFDEVVKKRGKHYGALSLVYDPAWRFFRSYILRGEFTKGTAGFINAVLDSYYRFIMIAKIIESKTDDKK